MLFTCTPWSGFLGAALCSALLFFRDRPMKLNDTQKAWLFMALCVLLVLLLFPPWVTTNYGYGGFINTERVGHASLWAVHSNSQLDVTVLGCELLALGAVTAFLVYCSGGSGSGRTEQQCADKNADLRHEPLP